MQPFHGFPPKCPLQKAKVNSLILRNRQIRRPRHAKRRDPENFREKLGESRKRPSFPDAFSAFYRLKPLEVRALPGENPVQLTLLLH